MIDSAPESLRPLLRNFENDVLSNKIGKLKGHHVKLHIDKQVKPVAQRERRIPFALREKAREELDKLEKAGIIEDVTNEPTPWLNPLVIAPKPNGKIRLCLDMRCANKAISRTNYPTPTIDDLKCKLKGSAIFSKLDLRSAFHQLELDPECRYITAFQTDTRIKRFKRLLFGVNSAPEELQHVLRALIADIDGVINIWDDLLIHAKTVSEHNEILLKVLTRFRDNGLTLNLVKCEFLKDSIEFYGHVFSKDGMKPNPAKVEAILNAKRPENQKALRSFLGLTNYLKSFINDYSTITFPLRQLLKKDTDWHWTPECDQAFEKLKTEMSSDKCIAYFDNNKETFMYTDASPFGVSAIVLQKSPGEESGKIVCFSSRALSKTEMRYAQIERECLALVYGCERNRLYLLGRHFTANTDHKSLVNILTNPKSNIPLRIERLALRLQHYDFTLNHVKSEDNISDYPSRHPHDTPDDELSDTVEEYVNEITVQSCPNALTLEDIQEATKADPTLQEVIKFANDRKWYRLDEKNDYDTSLLNELKAFRKFKDELTVTSTGILLKGRRIVLPKVLQNVAINIAHVGHQGINKTKMLLRTKIFFRNMDKLVETKISNCLACQAVERQTKSTPLKPTEIPRNVWDTLNVDYLGPLPNGKYLFVLIDQRSRYPVVDFTKSTDATTAIKSLNRTFNLFGNPIYIVSDNGPPFTSQRLKEFLQSRGVKQRKITPLWPQANGEAERFMRPLNKTIRTAHLEGKDIETEVQKFLFAYRNTPHSSTKTTPSEVMFNRKTNFNLPQVDDTVETNLRQNTDANDKKSKSYNKNYIDTKRRAQDIFFKRGDRVLVRQPKENKLTTFYNPKPLRVTHVKGPMVTAQFENAENGITRHSTHFKKLAPSAGLPTVEKQKNIQLERKQYSLRERK